MEALRRLDMSFDVMVFDAGVDGRTLHCRPFPISRRARAWRCCRRINAPNFRNSPRKGIPRLSDEACAPVLVRAATCRSASWRPEHWNHAGARQTRHPSKESAAASRQRAEAEQKLPGYAEARTRRARARAGDANSPTGRRSTASLWTARRARQRGDQTNARTFASGETEPMSSASRPNPCLRGKSPSVADTCGRWDLHAPRRV